MFIVLFKANGILILLGSLLSKEILSGSFVFVATTMRTPQTAFCFVCGSTAIHMYNHTKLESWVEPGDKDA